MHYNGAKVLDADDDVHVSLHMEIFEITYVDSDRGLEWLLQDLCMSD